jgi:hypothetical protein
MPLGNGDIGLNAWVEPSGDLLFYISKTDSWGDNARLLKIGKVRVTFDPPLLKQGGTFRQELDLETGTLTVRMPDADRSEPNVRLWVDANNPVIQVCVDSDSEISATASFELWRTERLTLPSIEGSDVMFDYKKSKHMHAPTVVEPDTVLTGLKNRIGWYHRNIKSVGPKQHAEIQGMTGYKREDPLLHRTFGAIISGDDVIRVDDTHLLSQKSKTHRFSVYVLTKHPASEAEWLSAMDKTIKKTERKSFEKRRRKHEAWWQNFWDRSYIHITQNKLKTKWLMPKNKIPVRIGVDQSGANRFAGEIKSAAVIDHVLSKQEIAARYKGGVPTKDSADKKISKAALSGNITIEAWLKPQKQTSDGGRIVDKCTPGAGDGFLLDTYPGNSLRLIVGKEIIAKKNCLKVGKWQYVVATVDAKAGTLKIYLDGKEVAASGASARKDETFILSRAYALQRFIDACAGRGRYPIKFNGSIFTVPYAGKPGDADYRRWGPGYWWQNTRLPYLSMCACGDFEMLEPLFRLYADDVLPINKYRTKHYFGFDKAAYYVECIHFWGDVFNESYGWQPMAERKDPLQVSGWHKWEWVAGPELVWMMLDAYDYTLDKSLLKKRIIPTANAVMRFFDNYYKMDASGTLVMHPSQAAETWWDCTNPMPEVAGLRAITARLLALPKKQTSKEDRAYWKTFMKKIPELPTCERKGARMWAPAEKFAKKHNVENPELYSVFPFRLCSFENKNRELGIQALRHRWSRGAAGWRQDDVFMAYLGLAEDARKNVISRARNYHKGSRFPAFWGPNYDWVPDQDHGGILMKTVQAMILQPDPYSRKIYLAPALPDNWSCEFKLHAPYRTIIEGRIEKGKVVDLKVTPKSRRKDIVISP